MLTALRQVRWGVAAAVLLVVLAAISAWWNPVTALPHLLVFSAVAIGLHRGRPWSGFGGALFLAASIASIAFALWRSGQLSTFAASVFVTALLYAVPATLLFRAGRALQQTNTTVHAPPLRWLALAAIMVAFPLVFNPVVVNSGSMENTILAGDQLLVLRLPVGAPQRGDLISLRYPVDPSQSFIKRVIATGGDRIRFVDGKLILNGAPQNEPYTQHTAKEPDSFLTNFPNGAATFSPILDWPVQLAKNTRNSELIVPAGKLFVLGDNRDNSLDSRHWGFLDPNDVLGRPALIYFSKDPLTGHMRWSRLFRPL